MTAAALRLAQDEPFRPAAVPPPRSHSSRLLAALEAVDRLPVPIVTRARFGTLVERHASSDSALVTVAGSDPALTAALLRFANRYGGGSADTPRAALTHLARDHAARLVRALPAYTAGASGDAWVDAVCGFRAHGLAVARVAHLIARELGEHPERAATVALLHDVGRLALDQVHPGSATGAATPEEHLEAERRTTGVDHAALGGLVARRWSLPKSVSSAIERHHDPEALGIPGVVRLADMLVHHAAGARISLGELSAAAARVGLGSDALDTLMYEGTARGSADSGQPCPLSPRQLELVRALGEGRQYNQIAHELGISASTVRSHLHAAYQRLGVSDRAQAVLLCASHGWIKPVLVPA